MNSLRTLTDQALAAEAARLERKVAALRLGQTAIAARLYADFADALDQARAERERRQT